MTYTVNTWREAKSSSLSPSAKLTLSQIFDHSKHLGDYDFIISLAQTRLDYKRRGYTFLPESQRHDKNETSDLKRLIEEEYNALGRPKEHWKKPEEVEQYIKAHVSEDILMALDSVTNGQSPSKVQKSFMSLITSLATNYVCFGDGPRWSFVYISMTVGGWLQNMKA